MAQTPLSFKQVKTFLAPHYLAVPPNSLTWTRHWRCRISQKRGYLARTSGAFYCQMMHRISAYQILEKNSPLPVAQANFV